MSQQPEDFNTAFNDIVEALDANGEPIRKIELGPNNEFVATIESALQGAQPELQFGLADGGTHLFLASLDEDHVIGISKYPTIPLAENEKGEQADDTDVSFSYAVTHLSYADDELCATNLSAKANPSGSFTLTATQQEGSSQLFELWDDEITQASQQAIQLMGSGRAISMADALGRRRYLPLAEVTGREARGVWNALAPAMRIAQQYGVPLPEDTGKVRKYITTEVRHPSNDLPIYNLVVTPSGDTDTTSAHITFGASYSLTDRPHQWFVVRAERSAGRTSVSYFLLSDENHYAPITLTPQQRRFVHESLEFHFSPNNLKNVRQQGSEY